MDTCCVSAYKPALFDCARFMVAVVVACIFMCGLIKQDGMQRDMSIQGFR